MFTKTYYREGYMEVQLVIGSKLLEEVEQFNPDYVGTYGDEFLCSWIVYEDEEEQCLTGSIDGWLESK